MIHKAILDERGCDTFFSTSSPAINSKFRLAFSGRVTNRSNSSPVINRVWITTLHLDRLLCLQYRRICHENQAFRSRLWWAFAAGGERFYVTFSGSRSAQLCDTCGSLQRLRLKQQGRLMPLLSLSSATSICFWRVSFVLTARIHRIQSQRASGVMSFHNASASGEAASAACKAS